MKIQHQISGKSYKASGFIGRYQKLVTDTVIPWQEKILMDEAPDTEKSHAIANFINAGKVLRGEDPGDADGAAREKRTGASGFRGLEGSRVSDPNARGRARPDPGGGRHPHGNRQLFP